MSADLLRAPRWPLRARVTVTVETSGAAGDMLEGTAENVSLEGALLCLPVELSKGAKIGVALEGERVRPGVVAWSKTQGESGVLLGVQFHVPRERHALHSRPLRHLRLRRWFRRILLWLISLVGMAIAAYALVWLIGVLQVYNPQFYEPKDIERQRSQQPEQGQKLRRPDQP